MIPIVLSPDSTYATRRNIAYPGKTAQATASAAAATTRINDTLPSGMTVTGVTIPSVTGE